MYGAGYGRVFPHGVEKFLVHVVTVQDECHRLGKHVIIQQAVDPVGLATIVGPMIIMGDPAWNGMIDFILCTSMLNGLRASEGLGWE